MTIGPGSQMSRLRRSLALVRAILVVAGAGAIPASAHDSTNHSLRLQLSKERIAVIASVPFAEIGYRDTTGDGLIDRQELRAQEAKVSPTIVHTVRSKVTLRVDGKELPIVGAGVPGVSQFSNGPLGSEYVTLALMTGPHDGAVDSVALKWAFASPTPSVLLAHPEGLVGGVLNDHHSVVFTLGTVATLTSFFVLGVEHIQFGPDHLLFLVVLTLAVVGTAATKSAAWRTVKLVAAFTVGHAISLCLAYFDLIVVPAVLVEPAIALSIVAAAVMVMIGRTEGARSWIATLIGLIHGLGFAGSLASIGIATSQRVSALAAFNVGIDVAQTVVVLMIFAALWLASRVMTDRMNWIRISTAAVAALVGLFWTLDRLTGMSA